MYDKKDEPLEVGDYVETYQRTVDNRKTRIAIITEIDPQSATLVINSEGMFVPFSSTPRFLLKRKPIMVDAKTRQSLNVAKAMFDEVKLGLLGV